MAEQYARRRLAAVLAADVVGYSRLIEADEEGTRARVRRLYADLVEPRIAADGGRIVKTTGDGVLVEFPSAVAAVRSALAVQSAMAGRDPDLPQQSLIRLRVGINVGDVIVEGDDIHGDAVNVAARLEGLCAPGEVYVSGTVYDQVAGKLSASFEALGEKAVKNIARPVRVYRLSPNVRLTDAIPRSADIVARSNRPAIAVLPFVNMSDSTEQEYFSDGITEDLITALTQIRAFRVIARNSTFAYKGSAARIEQIAHDLGVRYVVEGSVRKAGDRVRVTAQVIEGATGAQVWAKRFDRDLTDIFALQDELVTTLAGAIEPALGEAERDRARLARPDSLGTWEIYQRGMAAMYRRTRERLAEAAELFRQGISRDGGFAPAHSGLAVTCFYQVVTGASGSPDEAREMALAAARRAVEIDVSDAAAHCALGRVLRVWGDAKAAAAEFQTALRLSPGNAEAHYGLGATLARNGSPRESLSHLQAAISLSPQDPWLCTFYTRMAEAHLLLGEDEKALDCARRAMHLPNRALGQHGALISALGHLGRTEEARAAIADLSALRPGLTVSLMREHQQIRGGYMDRYVEGLRKAGLPE